MTIEERLHKWIDDPRWPTDTSPGWESDIRRDIAEALSEIQFLRKHVGVISRGSDLTAIKRELGPCRGWRREGTGE